MLLSLVVGFEFVVCCIASEELLMRPLGLTKTSLNCKCKWVCQGVYVCVCVCGSEIVI